MQKLFLFTASYPFSLAKEDSFLNPEIDVLRKSFSITLIPLSIGGDMCNVHESVQILTDYAERYRSSNSLLWIKIPYVFFSKFFYRELIDNFYIVFNIKAIKKLVHSSLRRKEFYLWLKKYHHDNKLFDNSILYTYWFDYATSAIIDLCKEINNSVVCTRAHGCDLYKERYSNGFIPFRKKALDEIDRVFLVSKSSFDYLSNNYPYASIKFRLSPLGINDRNIVVRKSKDNCFRIVSCFFVSPIKRIEMIVEVICELSNNSDVKIEWFHIGGGSNLHFVEEYAAKKFSHRVCFHFLGNKKNKDIFEFYNNHYIDLFILLSRSEGGRSVALMEAASVSLPIVATNVGGIPEMVIDGVNGILVDVNESPKNIAFEIKKIVDSPEILNKMKIASYEIWKKNADAEINFTIFADQLFDMVK